MCIRDSIKRAGFRADAVAILKECQRQRPQTVLVADRIHAVLGHDDESERPFHLAAGAHDLLNERSRFPLDQMQHDLAVTAALEDAAQIFQFFFQFAGVDNLPVMHGPEMPGMCADHDRLHVFDLIAAVGRIPDMADRMDAVHLVDRFSVEHFRDQALALDAVSYTHLDVYKRQPRRRHWIVRGPS